MGFLLSAITSRLAGPALSALCVILLAFGMTQCTGRQLETRRADRLERAISEPATGWSARLATCQGNEATLKASLDAQNAAVAALGQESAARVAQSAKAASDARAVAESLRRNADVILGQTTAVGEDRCMAADRIILEEAGR